MVGWNHLSTGKARGPRSMANLPFDDAGRLTSSPSFDVIAGLPRCTRSGHWIHHETYLPSLQGPSCPNPRLSRSNEVARRPGGHQRASGQGTQASGCLRPATAARAGGSPIVSVVQRLVESAEFERVLATASRARTAHFAIHHGAAALPPALFGPFTTKLSTIEAETGAPLVDDLSLTAPFHRLGAVVPKRHARRAVTRSLLKRQIYAAGARHAPALVGGTWVVRLRAPFDRRDYPSAASAALRESARGELDALFAAASRGSKP